MRHQRKILKGLLILGLPVCLFLGFPSPNAPKIYNIDLLSDTVSGLKGCPAKVCSLRRALSQAQDGDLLILPKGTLQITQALVIKHRGTLTIQGQGMGKTILSGDWDSDGRADSALFKIVSGKILLQDLSLHYGGQAQGKASAVTIAAQHQGPEVTLQNVEIAHSQSQGKGGAIYWAKDKSNKGSLKIFHSRFINNQSQNHGGAIYFGGNLLEIKDSHFLENQSAKAGGAVFGVGKKSQALFINFFNNLFEDNRAAQGGALHLSQAAVHLNQNQFLHNQANQGKRSRNFGGAVYLGPLTVEVIIRKNTFKENLALKGGGAIFHERIADLNQNTFSQNQAPQGAHLWTAPGGTAILKNNLLGSAKLGKPCKIQGLMDSLGFNRENQHSCWLKHPQDRQGQEIKTLDLAQDKPIQQKPAMASSKKLSPEP